MTIRHDVVRVGSNVMVRHGQNVKVLSIVHGVGDPLRNVISKISPVARALLGHHVNDQVHVETPSGVQTYTVVQVL